MTVGRASIEVADLVSRGSAIRLGQRPQFSSSKSAHLTDAKNCEIMGGWFRDNAVSRQGTDVCLRAAHLKSQISRPLSSTTERIATIWSMCGLMRILGPPTVIAAAKDEAILRPTANAETSATVSLMLSP